MNRVVRIIAISMSSPVFSRLIASDKSEFTQLVSRPDNNLALQRDTAVVQDRLLNVVH